MKIDQTILQLLAEQGTPMQLPMIAAELDEDPQAVLDALRSLIASGSVEHASGFYSRIS